MLTNTQPRTLFTPPPAVNETTVVRATLTRDHVERGLAASRALFPLLHGLPKLPNPAHPAYVPATPETPAHIDPSALPPSLAELRASVGWAGVSEVMRQLLSDVGTPTGPGVPAFIDSRPPLAYTWRVPVGGRLTNDPCRCGGVGYMVADPIPAPRSNAPLPRAYCSCAAGQEMARLARDAFNWEFIGAAGPDATDTARVVLPIRGLQAPRFAGIRDSALGAYTPRTAEQRAALKVVRGVVAGDAAAQGRTGVILYGPTGTGKTHLAVATLRALRDARPSASVRAVHVEEVAQLLETLRFRLNDYSQVERHAFRDELLALEATQTLLIDDLGTESVTGPIREELIAFLERRFLAKGHRTVITTNVDPTTPRFVELYGDRCLSRARSVLAVAAVGGTDLRAEEATW